MGRTQNITNQFEVLESRTMMSAAPVLHAVPRAALHGAMVKPVVIKTVNPITTEKDITYKSFASDPLFAEGGATIADVNQGYLGDCYLLATLSSVVKTDPALIRKEIVADGNGIYTVTFGGSTKININADLPVWPDGRLAYAQLGDQNSLWVALMEKAYVQYTNPKTDKYASIEGGWMSSAFAALGLKSSSLFASSTATTLMKTLKADLASGDFVTLGTDAKLAKDSPLVASHAYEVDAVVTDRAGTPVSVTLRNPWGESTENKGYVTITAKQAFAAFSGVVISHA